MLCTSGAGKEKHKGQPTIRKRPKNDSQCSFIELSNRLSVACGECKVHVPCWWAGLWDGRIVAFCAQFEESLWLYASEPKVWSSECGGAKAEDFAIEEADLDRVSKWLERCEVKVAYDGELFWGDVDANVVDWHFRLYVVFAAFVSEKMRVKWQEC